VRAPDEDSLKIDAEKDKRVNDEGGTRGVEDSGWVSSSRCSLRTPFLLTIMKYDFVQARQPAEVTSWILEGQPYGVGKSILYKTNNNIK